MAYIGYSLNKIASLIRGGTIPQISEVTNITTPVVDIDTQTSVNAKALKGGFTFERTQTDPQSTSAINRYGDLEYYDNDQERFGKYGMLIEPQATNLLTYSENFLSTTSNWLNIDSLVITENTSIAPDGNTTADTFDNTANLQGRALQLYTQSGTNTYTFSLWVKSTTNRVLSIEITNQGGTAFKQVFSCNVTTEWQRFSVTATTNADNTGVYALIGRSSSDQANDFYIWGAQLELGSIPTSYIPTTTTAVTRSRDTIDLDPTNFPTITSGVTIHQKWYSDDWDKNSTTGSTRYLLSIGSGTLNRIIIYMINGVLTARTVSSNVKDTFYDISTLNTVDLKLVIGDTTNELYINGVLVDSISRGGEDALSSIPSYFGIGRNSANPATSYQEANAQHIFTKIYPKALTASECRL